jgi:hypothetical protein
MLNVSSIKAVSPSFTGGANITSKLGSFIKKSNIATKVANKMEYDGLSMSMTSMMILLYGATIVPRYINATDKYDRREILTRDFLSITSILFAAKALNKSISHAFAKTTGFVLNTIPKKLAGKNWYQKLGHYLNPTDNSVMSYSELEKKYSNFEKYPEKIKGFIDFVHSQKGSVQKILSKGKVAAITAKAIGEKDAAALKSMSEKDICAKLIEADKKGTDGIKAFYETMKDEKNPLVTKAKTMNSTFDFASTCLIVPLFMLWIERYNEQKTKKLKAQENAQKANISNSQAPKDMKKENSKVFANFAGNSKV